MIHTQVAPAVRMKKLLFSEQSILYYQIRDAAVYWIVIPVLVISSGWLFQHLTGISSIAPNMLIYFLGASLSLTGIVLIFKSIYDLKHYGGGTPNYRKPPVRLVKEGAYSLCRHPMFLGYDLVAIGVALVIGSTGMLLFSIPLMLLFEVRFLKKEEGRLRKRFGDEFVEYSKRVPFLVPFIKIKRTC